MAKPPAGKKPASRKTPSTPEVKKKTAGVAAPACKRSPTKVKPKAPAKAAPRTRKTESPATVIVEDMGREPHTVVIEGDAITPDRTIHINKPEQDPTTGMAYLGNDLQRTRLRVALEDVPSTSSYRGQQLNAMSEAVKSLPPQYQAAAMPFFASLMDVPFKRQLVEALRAADAPETPEQVEQVEQVEQRIKQSVTDALTKAGNDLKARELDMKERKTEAEIRKLMADAVQVGV